MSVLRKLKSFQFLLKPPPNCLQLERLSHQKPESPFFLSVTELHRNGDKTSTDLTVEDVVKILKKNEFKLPLRDLKIFFKSTAETTGSPAILPRPASQCFLLELEHIKLICTRDRCIILNPNNNIVNNFINDLTQSCSSYQPLQNCHTESLPIKEYLKMLTSDIQDMAFEHVVLEQALANVTRKFVRHVNLTKPALDMMLQQISQDPSTAMLRRLLAFRKSLGEFENMVGHVKRVVVDLLNNDGDMANLYLTHSDREIHDHEEVELLLEAYSNDLSEIEAEIRAMKEMVEETNQFINTHLDSVRNRMIRMSLFMEMGALSMGTGAVVGGVMGMNLTHGLEEHPTAFFIFVGGVVAVMSGVFGGVAMKYSRLVADTSRAQSFKAIKNFFQYVDELDKIVEARGDNSFTKVEFKEVLNKVTGTTVTDEESDFIFKMFDADKDGRLKAEELRLASEKKVL